MMFGEKKSRAEDVRDDDVQRPSVGPRLDLELQPAEEHNLHSSSTHPDNNHGK